MATHLRIKITHLVMRIHPPIKQQLDYSNILHIELKANTKETLIEWKKNTIHFIQNKNQKIISRLKFGSTLY